MTGPTLPDGHRAELSAIEVVPRAVADELIADATATISSLERELDELQPVPSRDGERQDVVADFLIEQAQAIVDDARAHRAKVIEGARAEAATTTRSWSTSCGSRRSAPCRPT